MEWKTTTTTYLPARWKYRTVACVHNPISEKKLKEMGREGWELSGVVKNKEYRQISERMPPGLPSGTHVEVYHYYFRKPGTDVSEAISERDLALDEAIQVAHHLADAYGKTSEKQGDYHYGKMGAANSVAEAIAKIKSRKP